jgi:pimeloyl-ACP methyl ester carboxylesterase
MTKRYDCKFDGADGIRLAAMVRGPEDGPVVLLAHGGGQTHWAWRKTVTLLADQGFRAIAIDLRGHGDSDRAPDGGYTPIDVAKDIVAIARQIGPKPAMVGASLGGMAGMMAEGELSPGLFSSLTLVDITANPNVEGVARINAFMGQHVEDGFASLDEAAEVIGGYTKNRTRRGPSDSLSRYLRKGADGRFRWHWDPALMASFTITDPLYRERMATAAQSLSLPVHLVRGGASDLVGPEDAKAFLELVPHADYTDIAGAGHMVVGDRNDAFSDAVIAFLKAHRHG